MKTQPRTNCSRTAGFSATELVIVVLVLAILMGVVNLRSGTLLHQTKITKITQTVTALKSACSLFHTDTAQYARHLPGENEQLLRSGLPGWNGPYLEGASLNESNPFGEFHVDNDHTGFGLVTGWDLDSDGVEEISGPCNVILLTGVDGRGADKLDAFYDANKAGDWEKAGRFQYIPASQSGLIFLYQ